MNKTLEAVRAKVIEAVPEIRATERKLLRKNEFGQKFYKDEVSLRPITLADVLRAIEENAGLGFENGVFVEYLGMQTKKRAYWNLALPLDEQEPEVIEFLANILLKDTLGGKEV